jgi:hypothetical protein
MGVYCGCSSKLGGETGDAKWFREAWARTGKKLEMGKACVRFKKLENVALDVIGEAIRRLPAKLYIERVESALVGTKPKASAKTKPTAKKTSAKKKTPAKKKTSARTR